jgi:TQXA domain-containing protein
VAVRRHARAHPTDVSRMTRYRGGTYSHTVDTIVFTDGTSARTDLIRLNPNFAAYSLDFTGHAPTGPSHYRAADWAAVPHLRTRAHEAEVGWILRNSFPTLTLAELSRRLRAAGYPLGGANIAEHEAIAATQAAIWHFTNDLDLDNRPRNVPVVERRGPEGIDFEFDDEPELGGYTVELVSRTAVSLLLQKSADGVTWSDVTASGLNVEAGHGAHRKPLGVGSTVARSRHGRGGSGYRYYRLMVLGDAAVVVGAVAFWLNGARAYANTDRVVHLYDYLLKGALDARAQSPTVRLVSDDAIFEDGVVGPLKVESADGAALAVSQGCLVDADGVELVGRVITGVARDDANSRLTPVALAVPSPLVVDFAIYLDARQESAG